MHSRLAMTIGDWLTKAMKWHIPKVATWGKVLRLEFIPWFSVAGFVTVILFCIAFGSVLSHFLTQEILDRDVMFSRQFIDSVEETQSFQAHLPSQVRLGQLLDKRTNPSSLGVDAQQAESVRNQFYDHISELPDLLLVNIFAPDSTVIWSTNPSLIGHVSEDNDELEEVLAKRTNIATEHFNEEHHKDEQQFTVEPEGAFIESYVPLFDARQNVVAIVEIYKEPKYMQQTIRRGKVLIWSCIALGAIFLYGAPFWIFQRADGALNDQQRRLREAETLCVIGEMSAAVAHGIRNPLASIRSSAELALDADPEAARKNAEDIIVQVDRLGKWVRELLVFSRPVSGEVQEVNLVRLVDECLPNFSTQLQHNKITCEFVRPVDSVPPVVGNGALVNQALASVICNAIEAMPAGGTLRLELQVSNLRRRVELVVSDTGIGMSANQIELAFKPFYTTKRNGVGLGVSQVRRIMERFGGEIILNSKAGQGTQACLSFRMV